MMDLLNFMFQSFWHFVGCLMILTILVMPVTAFLGALGHGLGWRRK